MEGQRFDLLALSAALMGLAVHPAGLDREAAVYVLALRAGGIRNDVPGILLTGYTFGGKDGFRMALGMTAGALLAICGAWSQFRKKDEPAEVIG